MNDAPPTLLLLGCGQLASALGEYYANAGWRVIGVRRNAALVPEAFEAQAADFSDPESLGILADIAADYVLVSLTPGERSEAAYQRAFVEGVGNILAALNTTGLQRLLFTSSTSVYHQCESEWVDEESETRPQGFSGRAVLSAEQQLLDSGLPVTLLRYGGIYSGDSLRTIRQVQEGRCAPPRPVRYSNRIHREDCVAVLRHVIAMQRKGEPVASCYLSVDDEPAPIAEVHQWLAQQLGIDCRADPDYRVTTGSKRCSNRRLRETGFEFRYPDYRAGYSAVLAENDLPASL